VTKHSSLYSADACAVTAIGWPTFVITCISVGLDKLYCQTVLYQFEIESGPLTSLPTDTASAFRFAGRREREREGERERETERERTQKAEGRWVRRKCFPGVGPWNLWNVLVGRLVDRWNGIAGFVIAVVWHLHFRLVADVCFTCVCVSRHQSAAHHTENIANKFSCTYKEIKTSIHHHYAYKLFSSEPFIFVV